jgi:ribose transport system permease protein
MILGAITGGLYTALRIPSFVISLGMVLIYEVAGSSLSGSQNFISLGSSLTILGSPLWTVAIGALVFGIFTLIFYRTEFAYHVRAVGGDELVAKNMGVKVGLTKALTYVVGGFFIGVVSILNVSYAGTVAAQLAMSSFSMVFMPMMGMIIGMQLLNVCSLPLGIFIGELSINMIFLGFMAVGLPSTLQNSVLGAFLLIVIGFSENKRKLQRLFGGSKTVAVAATH